MVVSDAIQLVAQLDHSSGNGSRLFSRPITAPGAAATFAPLPAGALAAAGAGSNDGGAVRTQFVALKFNPWDTSGSSGGGQVVGAVAPSLARLSFADAGGEELSVAGLSHPILFTMPAAAALPVDGSAAASCAYWDASARRFNDTGCAALPAPAPGNHTISWVASASPAQPQPPQMANSSSAACAAAADAQGAAFDSGLANVTAAKALAAQWAIAGPLACDCSVTVLDCAADAAAAAAAAAAMMAAGGGKAAAAAAAKRARRRVYVSPRDALTMPALECAEGDKSTVMRIFYGESCQLWNPNNTARCYWNATKQARPSSQPPFGQRGGRTCCWFAESVRNATCSRQTASKALSTARAPSRQAS